MLSNLKSSVIRVIQARLGDLLVRKDDGSPCKGQAEYSYLRWRSSSAFRVLRIVVFTLSMFAAAASYADYDTPFDRLKITETFGDLAPHQIDVLRNIWDKQKYTILTGLQSTREGSFFTNVQQDKLRFEFMDYLLFPENYVIQRVTPGTEIDPFITRAIRYPPLSKFALHWVVDEDGQLIVGAGKSKGPEFKHSIIASRA